MLRDDELLDRMEQEEDYMILYRLYSCVKKMLKAKENNEEYFPKQWIDNLDIPSKLCEYTPEQYENVQEVKAELECLARKLELKAI